MDKNQISRRTVLGGIGAGGLMLAAPAAALAARKANGQAAWAYCARCAGLWFSGNATAGKPSGWCPAGGGHSINTSSSYTLSWTPGSGNQDNWRWCGKCSGLWFAGNPGSACPAGGAHTSQGSADYVLSWSGGAGQSNWHWCQACQGLWFAPPNQFSQGYCPARGSVGHTQAGSANYTVNAWSAPTWSASGESLGTMDAFDQAMQTFMTLRGIPCGQLAVTFQGSGDTAPRLVMAKSYLNGPNQSLGLQPTSLFRIASLSKPVTSAAVLSLATAGKLGGDPSSVSSLVSSVLAQNIQHFISLRPAAGLTADPRLNAVSVLKLLQHTSGLPGSTDPTDTYVLDGWDPMFSDKTIAAFFGPQFSACGLPINQADIISYTSGQRLSFNPGSQWGYCNYGYLLLGRLIEAVTGMSYPEAVQQWVLGPLGISRMRVGTSFGISQGEVPYFSTNAWGPTVTSCSTAPVAAAYGTFNLANMDSHGGWLASAVDMVRLAHVLDSGNPVLNSTARSVLTSYSGAGQSTLSYYGCGWGVGPVDNNGTPSAPGTKFNCDHTGSLPGTYTYIMHSWGGVCFCALFNQRDDPSGSNYGDIGGALWNASNNVTWPSSGDLFPTYL